MDKNPIPHGSVECESVILLAVAYSMGMDTKKGQFKSLKYYKYAAECGSKLALFNTAYIYAYSKNKKIYNIDKGIHYFKRAAFAIRLGCKYHYQDAVDNLSEISKDEAKLIVSGKYSPLIDG